MECRGGTSSMRRNVRSRAPLKYRKTYKAKVCWNTASAWRSLEFPMAIAEKWSGSSELFERRAMIDFALNHRATKHCISRSNGLSWQWFIPNFEDLVVIVSIRARIPFEFITFRSLTYATTAINDSISYR